MPRPLSLKRRSLLKAGLAVGLTAAAGAVQAQTPAWRAEPGDFDFLAGEWRQSHRRMTGAGPEGPVWDEFEGEATCWSILQGVGSIEELRIPARNFSGMGLRMLDIENRRWGDHWVNARSGVVGVPPQWGGFIDGAGVFIVEDADDQGPVQYRGLWDQIGARSCRWSQASSRDGGQTWEDNWVMLWRKV